MITILCVGKMKEKFMTEAVFEYQKRLQKYTKLEIIEVPDVDFDNKELALIKESTSLMHYIKPKDFVITLEIDGSMLDSISFSQKLEKVCMENSSIVFIIGGSYGLHSDIKIRSNLSLSFSKFTFPHQLFRILLLEQIYRGFRIIKNENYHK